MKVKELIEILQNFNTEMEVIINSNDEANNYSPLSDVEIGGYYKENTWFGQRDDDDPDSIFSVFLYPANLKGINSEPV